MTLRRTTTAAGVGLLTLMATSGVAAAQPSNGRTIYGVTSNGNRLVSFPANNPAAAAVVSSTGNGVISGLVGTASERVVGLDFRPSDSVLFALTIDAITGTSNAQTGTGRLYTVDKTTAAATLVQVLGTSLSGAYYDIGFNPVANALRIVSSNGQNLRVPTGGTGTAVADTTLAYASGDKNSGTSPLVAAIDYTPAAGSATTLYDADYGIDTLSVQGAVGGGTAGTAASPNSGVLNTVGTTGFGVNVTNLLGMDVETDGTIYMDAQTVDNATQGVSTGSALFTVNPTTGAATKIGDIGGDIIDSIAIDNSVPAVTPTLPEFGLTALAPISALAMAGGVLFVRRRRAVSDEA